LEEIAVILIFDKGAFCRSQGKHLYAPWVKSQKLSPDDAPQAITAQVREIKQVRLPSQQAGLGKLGMVCMPAVFANF